MLQVINTSIRLREILKYDEILSLLKEIHNNENISQRIEDVELYLNLYLNLQLNLIILLLMKL